MSQIYISISLFLLVGQVCLADPFADAATSHCDAQDDMQGVEVSLLQASLSVKGPNFRSVGLLQPHQSSKATLLAAEPAHNKTLNDTITNVHEAELTLKVINFKQIQTAGSNKELAPLDEKPKAIWFLLLALAFEGALCIFLTSFHESAPAGPSQTESSKAPHVLALDGQRTISITIMICMHLGAIHESAFIFSGCTFFTLLSGVVRSLQKGQSDFTLSEYRKACAMIIARFCPANGMALLLHLLVPGCSFDGAQVYWKQALFLQGFELGMNPLNSLKFSGNGPVWFLGVLFWCTLIFPLLHNIRPRGHVAYVLVPMVLLTCLHYALDTTNQQMAPDVYFAFMYNCDWCPSGQSLAGRLVQYFLGMLIAQLYFEMPKKLTEWSGWGWTFDVAWTAGWVIGLGAARHQGKQISGAFWYEGMMPLELLFLILLLIWGTMLLASICHQSTEGDNGRTRCSGILIRLCEARPLTYMAKYSLGAYMYHNVLWSFFGVAHNSSNGHVMTSWRYGWMNALPMPWFVPLALSWIMGMISEHVLETPIRMYIGYRILSRSNDPAAQAALMKHTCSSAKDQNDTVQS